ncbi:MAG: hypothetical protein IPP44_00270 [Ideonella sp.]|nr:hypothetical protein [Ideonella sp.]
MGASRIFHQHAKAACLREQLNSNVRPQMIRSLPREWTHYEYKDARSVLVGLRDIQRTLPLDELEYKVASLRSRELRPYLEGRQAALFCYGMGQALGTEVSFAQVEREDYDIVTRRLVGDELVYTPVQLKEWVPVRVNEQSSLQHEIDKLQKYVDSGSLVVAFCLNREARVDLRQR